MPDPDDLSLDDSQQSPGVHPPHHVEPESADDDIYALSEPEPPVAEVVPEAAEAVADEAPPPTLPSAPAVTAGDFMEPVDRLFSRPLLYRIIGRVCGLLAVLILLGSALLCFFGHSWFDGGLLFGLAFLVGEAAGAILEAVQRRD